MLRMTWKKSILFALLPLALAAQAACGGGGASAPGDPTELILEAATYVNIVDMKSLLESTPFPAFPSGSDDVPDAQDAWRDLWDDSDYAFETNPDIVTALITVQVYYDFETIPYTIINGEFDFDSIKNELEDEGFEEDSYHNQTIWEKDNGKSVALFEDVNTYVYGNSDTIREVLNAIDRGTGFIAADSDMKRAMDAAGDGLIRNATEDCDVIFIVGYRGDTFKGCNVYAEAVTGGDYDETKMTMAFVFRSERRAESGMEFLEDLIEGSDGIDTDIDEIEVSGNVVTAKTTIYRD